MIGSVTLTWNECAEIMRLGMTLGEPQIEEDAHGNLRDISYPIITISHKAMEALNAKKPKLTALLESMLNAARANPGQVQRRALASGLSIDLIAGLDGMLRIQLYREKGKYPSDTEWKTTMKYFPISLDAHQPEKFIANNRGYLRSAWETPKS